MRAPFIAGVLYLLVLWVAVDGHDVITGIPDSGGVARIAELAELIGPGASLAAAALCAYLLGTFVVVRDWPQLLTRSHWRALPAALYEMRKERMQSWWRWGSLRSAFRHGDLADWLRRRYPYNTDQFDPVWLYERADGLGTGMTARRTHDWAGRLDHWVYRQMENLHGTFTYRDLKSLDPPDAFWGEVYSAWRDFREFKWRRANNEMAYRGGDWDNGLDLTTVPENIELPPRYFDLRDDQIPPWDSTTEGWAENPDHEWWDFDANLDEEVHHVVLSEAFLADLREERQRLITKLKGQGQIYFNEYDRAKAEAELRYSAAIPLLLLVAALTFTWSPLALLGLPIPVLMVRQGLAIEMAGVADLYLALQYAGIQAPTMALLYEARDRARRGPKVGTPEP